MHPVKCSMQHAASYGLHDCNIVHHAPTAPATDSLHAHRAPCGAQPTVHKGITEHQCVYGARDARDTQTCTMHHRTTQPALMSLQHAPCEMKHAACTLENAARSMQRATSSMHPVKCSVQHAASYSLHDYNIMHHAPTAPATYSLHAHRAPCGAQPVVHSAAQRARKS